MRQCQSNGARTSTMIAVYMFAMLACASSAPQYFNHHRHEPFRHHGDFHLGNPYFNDDVFDTKRFWMELSEELMKFDEMMQDFSKHFPSSVSNEGVEGNEYKITISLIGFEEKEIVVKAREGVLMIQAVHKSEDGNERNYLDIRTLPKNVNVAGSWTYDRDVLKITFPLTEKPTEAPDTTTVAPVTEGSIQSREEMEPSHGDDAQDADVGLRGNDNDKMNELLTNEIPNRNTVEATTYAVDLKNEVEFVPMRY